MDSPFIPLLNQPKVWFVFLQKKRQQAKLAAAFFMCRGAGSNRRPHPLQGYALPTELPRQLSAGTAYTIPAKNSTAYLAKFASPETCVVTAEICAWISFKCGYRKYAAMTKNAIPRIHFNAEKTRDCLCRFEIFSSISLFSREIFSVSTKIRCMSRSVILSFSFI